MGGSSLRACVNRGRGMAALFCKRSERLLCAQVMPHSRVQQMTPSSPRMGTRVSR